MKSSSIIRFICEPVWTSIKSFTGHFPQVFSHFLAFLGKIYIIHIIFFFRFFTFSGNLNILSHCLVLTVVFWFVGLEFYFFSFLFS